MAFDKDQVYVGGGFSSVGPVVARSLAHYDGKRWSAVAGEPQLEWPQLNVMALEMFENALYVGGYFTNADGLAVGGIATLKNKRWTPLGVTNGTVLALRGDGRALLVAGRFTPPGFTNPVALARFDGRRWTVLNSELPPCDDLECVQDVAVIEPIGSTVFSLVKVAVAGWPYGVPVLAQYNDQNGWSGIPHPSPDELFWFQLSQFAGDLIFGGAFSNSAVPALRNIARWDGSQWQPLGDGLPGEVHALASSGPALYAAHTVDRTPPRRSRVSRWDGVTWTPLGTNDLLWDIPVRLAVGPDGAVYMSSLTYGIGSLASPGLLRWNGAEWESLFRGKNFQGTAGGVRTVRTFTHHEGNVFMGGIFLSAGAQVTQGIARWDGESWHDVGGGIFGHPAHRIESMHSHGGQLWAGGSFTNIGGVLSSNIAFWNGTNWHSAADGLNDLVVTLTGWRGGIVAGGRFTHSGDLRLNHVAHWENGAWHALGAGFNNHVLAVACWNDQLIAGGTFTSAGDVEVSSLAAWNGTQWQVLGGGVGGAERITVSRLAAGGAFLYAVGNFRTAGVESVTNIARWNGVAWQSVGGGFDGVITALATRADEVFLAGRRTNGFGESIEGGVYRLLGERWELLPDGPSHPGGPRWASVQALLPGEADLFIGGRFSWAGGRPSANIARWIRNPVARLSIERAESSLRVNLDVPPGVRAQLQASTEGGDWLDVPAAENTLVVEQPAAPKAQLFRAILRP